MPDYGEILEFLARNPPQLAAERQLHASLLELLAQCLRNDETRLEAGSPAAADMATGEADARITANHLKWSHFG